jgi:uncharacterized lipoprotein YmbA
VSAPAVGVRLLAVTAVVAGLAGCASAPPTSYLLSAPAATAAPGAHHSPVVAVGPVALPSYLDRSGIVVRRPGDEIVISTDHRWGEPLGDGVARVLAENLAAMIPTDAVAIFPWKTMWTPQFRVTVDIVHFEGPLSGPAALAARWRLLDDRGQVLALRAVTLQEPVTAPTHAGLVAAQGRLLTALSRDIAAAIRSHLR